MKYCSHCGAEIDDDADFCVHCGKRVGEEPSGSSTKSNNNKTLATIAEVFMVLTCASCGISAVSCLIIGLYFTVNGAYNDVGMACGVGMIVMAICSLIALAWVIPLTVYVFRRTKARAPVSTAAKVCILIFVNVISGILLLCMKESPESRPARE